MKDEQISKMGSFFKKFFYFLKAKISFLNLLAFYAGLS